MQHLTIQQNKTAVNGFKKEGNNQGSHHFKRVAVYPFVEKPMNKSPIPRSLAPAAGNIPFQLPNSQAEMVR